MKPNTVFFSLAFATISSAAILGAELKTGAICAGAATLSNGLIISIGQPFIGVMSATDSVTLSLGIVPLLGVTNSVNADRPTLSHSIVTSGVFQMSAAGSAKGNSYTLEATTDLMEWVPVITKPGTGSNLLFVDPDEASFAYRFYRLRIQ